MKWSFINTGINNGQYNMDYDLWLAHNFSPQDSVLRLYRWNPYCISLGANQSIEDVNCEKAEGDGIDVVKRPTGGKAILHSEELTYSVIYPIDESSSAKNIYNEINLALRKGLIEFDSSLGEIDLEHTQPDFKQFYKSEISAICFAVSAKSELNFRGKKIVGSAQRKIGNVILQHGSILCGEYHKKIVDYLNIDSSKKETILSEISDTTIDLKTALNYSIDYSKLSLALLKGFENHFSEEFEFSEHSQKVYNINSEVHLVR
jgi:lipoyl(octanoyl) transferase